ncbi:MAG: signaling recognition particle receptor family protein [Alphaproteobacteria bacterium]|nr:signaling recognition particle receptor family protein [Alphaproteobacteria bacterium]
MFFAKIRQIFSKKDSSQKSYVVTDDMMKSLEETLLSSNFGYALTCSIIERMKKMTGKVKGADSAEDLLSRSLELCLNEVTKGKVRDLKMSEQSPFVILLLGANGAGKTTLTPKLCRYYKNQGLKPLLVIGDTFRAAAQEQSAIWSQRVGVDVMEGKSGGDPASLAFEACERAQKEGHDVVIIDTAGRLHTNVDLMQQLKKINRVIQKVHPSFPHEVILALDATTGSYMVDQVKGYGSYVDLTGVVLTKADGYSAGGALMAVMQENLVDIVGVSYGEDIESYGPFKMEKFLQGLLKL